MVLVSYSGREINAKLVYYGPGLSGKTTNLEYIYGSIPNGQRGKMVSMKTKTERTLFFDFLPVHLGELSGFKTRFLLYTVPGQVYYNATRKLVLKGVDAVVFVADSKRGKMDENVESLENLRENLREHGLNLDQIPWVIQYNKRDLPDVYSVAELDGVLNAAKAPSFEAVATTGEGVVETFKGVSRLLLKKLAKEIGVSVVANEAAATPAPPPAPTLTTPTPILVPSTAATSVPVAPRPTAPTPAWSSPATFGAAAAPPAEPVRPVRAPEWGQETPSWDAPARPSLRPEPPQPRPAVFERVTPEPVSAPASTRPAAFESHDPVPFPRPETPPMPEPDANSEFRVEALTAEPEPAKTPEAPPAPAPMRSPEPAAYSAPAPPPTPEPIPSTLPPPAERIDPQAYRRVTTEKAAEKAERPNTVGERLRRWLSRNQEKETLREDIPSRYVPVTPPSREPVIEESPAEAAKEPIRFSDEEQAAISPDLSSRRELAPAPIESPETPSPEPAAESGFEAEAEAFPADPVPLEDESPAPPPAMEPERVVEPVSALAQAFEMPVDVAVSVEAPADLPVAGPPAGPPLETPLEVPSFGAAGVADPVAAPEAVATPEIVAAPMPPARVRASAPAVTRRPREIVVPIEIHPEDLENGISLKLALQAPWWEEQRNGEEMQGAA